MSSLANKFSGFVCCMFSSWKGPNCDLVSIHSIHQVVRSKKGANTKWNQFANQYPQYKYYNTEANRSNSCIQLIFSYSSPGNNNHNIKQYISINIFSNAAVLQTRKDIISYAQTRLINKSILETDKASVVHHPHFFGNKILNTCTKNTDK